jgi:hypothetical protein
MAWKHWLRGLLAAIIGGASSAVTLIVVDPLDFNFEAGLVRLGKVAVVMALVGAALYLKTHPDPWKE